MPSDFFTWRYINDRAFVPPLSVSVNDLQQCITPAVASADKDMGWCVWKELDYHINICHVTKGLHIEHFCL
jgi:hypothetical protein